MRTLIHDSIYLYSLNIYFNRLNEYKDYIFHVDERRIALDFSDLDIDIYNLSTYSDSLEIYTNLYNADFAYSYEDNISKLRKKLNLTPLSVREDSRYRFI